MQQMTIFTISTVDAGFYLLNLDLDPAFFPGIRTISVSYQSDGYLCPYSPDFSDYYQTFQGCIKNPASDQGLPCLSF
jgi:hypothetical protein